MKYQSCQDCYLMGICNLRYKYEGMTDYIYKFVKSDLQNFSCSFFCKHFKRRLTKDEKKDS